MNDSTIAFRAKEQLGKFLGKVFTHFSRPKQKFMADMLYGMQASGDTQLSSIMRAINDDPGMRHAVEKRLSRNLAATSPTKACARTSARPSCPKAPGT